MIELLTPPVAADPAAPVAPAAILGDGAPANFAALLGQVAPAMPGEAVPRPESVGPAIAQIAPVVPDAPVAEPAPVVALAAVALPSVTEPVNPAPAEAAEPVKLPTLPPGFFAQRLPAAVKAPKSEPKPAPPVEAEDEDVSGDSESPVAVAVPVPALTPPAAPPAALVTTAGIQLPAPAPVAAKPEEAGSAIEGQSGPPAAPLAAHVEASPVAAAKPEAARPEAAVFGAALVDAAPGADAKPDAPESLPPVAHARAEAPVIATAFAEALAVQQPVATPQPAIAAPQAQPSMSVALDELFVAAAPDSAWLDRLASDISVLASGESREAHLKINPRSLGEMSIKLEVEGHRTRVAFTVETPQALSLMTDGAPRLTQLVEANGLKLDGATVDLDQRRDGRADQQPQRDTPEPSRGLARARDEIARLVSRTRISTAQERFA